MLYLFFQVIIGVFMGNCESIKFESIIVPLLSSTGLPTGGENQKAPLQCHGCEFISDCTAIGAFFCALYSGRRVDAPSVIDGYFASAPRPSSVRGEVANGGLAYGLVTRSQSVTTSNYGENGGRL